MHGAGSIGPMNLLFALAGLAFAALAAGTLRTSGSVARLFGGRLLMLLFLVGGALACFLHADALTHDAFGRQVAGFLALLCAVRVLQAFLAAPGQGSLTQALLVLTLVYLTGVLGAAAAGVWVRPAPPPPPDLDALRAEWLAAWTATHQAAPAADAPHVHPEGTPPHAHGAGVAHGHDHSDEPPPHEVPIVEYVPPPQRGPHEGQVIRLATRANPNAGFVEVRLANDAGALDVWLYRDARLVETLDYDTARITARLRLLDEDPQGLLHLRPAAEAAAVGFGHFFVFRPQTRAEGRALQAEALPALFRLEILVRRPDDGTEAVLSDDFELYPRRDGAGN